VDHLPAAQSSAVAAGCLANRWRQPDEYQTHSDPKHEQGKDDKQHTIAVTATASKIMRISWTA
jgi:hypothetical protein